LVPLVNDYEKKAMQMAPGRISPRPQLLEARGIFGHFHPGFSSKTSYGKIYQQP